MEYIDTGLEGVFLMKPKVFGDDRGYFFERYVKKDFDAHVGAPVDFVQDNVSRSSYGVVRGLHFQKGDHAQAKLVTVTSGTVLDVALDLRPGSATFGKYVTAELSGDNHTSLFIPRGFAHGYAVLSEEALFEYKCDNYYCPEAEGGIDAFDAELGIDWRLPHSAIIRSPKDLLWPCINIFCGMGS